MSPENQNSAKKRKLNDDEQVNINLATDLSRARNLTT
jgi:hypothetical protein